MTQMTAIKRNKKEYGDWQTPQDFALRVCDFLKENKGVKPSLVIEPTCGKGSFVKGSLIFGADEIIGIEINPEYCSSCREEIQDERVKIVNADFFSFDLNALAKGREPLLVVGNPPWATNSELSRILSDNLPVKANFKGLSGLAAMTGESNFDIAEYMILRTLSALNGWHSTVAMLCKTSVARNVFRELKRTNIDFSLCEVYEFDAGKVFGVNASACLLVVELGGEKNERDVCDVYSLDEPSKCKGSFGFVDGVFYSNTRTASTQIAGRCCFNWRQGVKHDCASVMELKATDGGLVNGLGEKVEIERDCVFPLVKSSMFKNPIINEFKKYVIVTQRHINEDTRHIALDAPKTWSYLATHESLFAKRKSSIYKNAPRFAMFGVGDYSFAPYKVGVSGFYKKPLFCLLSSEDTPVMVDDTSYFLSFSTFNEAYAAMLLLNTQIVQDFLLSATFLDAKRPFTKKVLEQIDFGKILRVVGEEDLNETERLLGLESQFKPDMLLALENAAGRKQTELDLFN